MGNLHRAGVPLDPCSESDHVCQQQRVLGGGARRVDERASVHGAPGEPGAPRRAEQSLCPAGGVRAELCGALPGRCGRLVTSSCLGAARRAVEVGDHVGIRLVHGRRPVPGSPVRIVGMTEGLGQGGVHVAAVDARGGGVHGGPDERVPQLDLARGDLHEAGALCLGEGVRAGARGCRGALHGGECIESSAAATSSSCCAPGESRRARSRKTRSMVAVTGSCPGRLARPASWSDESACGISTRASGFPPVLATAARPPPGSRRSRSAPGAVRWWPPGPVP